MYACTYIVCAFFARRRTDWSARNLRLTSGGLLQTQVGFLVIVSSCDIFCEVLHKCTFFRQSDRNPWTNALITRPYLLLRTLIGCAKTTGYAL